MGAKSYIETSWRDQGNYTKHLGRNIIWTNDKGQAGDVTVKLRKFSFEINHVKMPRNTYMLQNLALTKLIPLSSLTEIYVSRIQCRAKGKHKIVFDVWAYA